MLEWKVDPLRAKRMEADPCARTYDFLNRLDSPELTLEEDARERGEAAQIQPYERAQPYHRTKDLSD